MLAIEMGLAVVRPRRTEALDHRRLGESLRCAYSSLGIRVVPHRWSGGRGNDDRIGDADAQALMVGRLNNDNI